MPYVYLFNLKINLIAQIISLAATVPVIIGYQQSKRGRLLLFMALANAILVGESVVLAAYPNIFRLAFGAARNVIIAVYLARGKKLPVWLPVTLLTVALVPSVFFIKGWVDVFPVAVMVTYTVFSLLPNEKAFRIYCAVNQLALIIYELLIGAYVTAIRDAIVLVFIVIGAVRVLRKFNLREATARVADSPCDSQDKLDKKPLADTVADNAAADIADDIAAERDKKA